MRATGRLANGHWKRLIPSPSSITIGSASPNRHSHVCGNPLTPGSLSDASGGPWRHDAYHASTGHAGLGIIRQGHRGDKNAVIFLELPQHTSTSSAGMFGRTPDWKPMPIHPRFAAALLDRSRALSSSPHPKPCRVPYRCLDSALHHRSLSRSVLRSGRLA